MLALEQMHPDVYTEFSMGHFAACKTKKMTSSMAIDQPHEQNNTVIKDNGSAISLTEYQTALGRWMAVGPEICRLVDEFSDISGNPQTKKNKRPPRGNILLSERLLQQNEKYDVGIRK